MTMLLRLLMICWLVLAAGLTTAEPPAEADDPTRQLLLMLHLPKPHYRPDGSYAGGYSDARLGQLARQRTVAALASHHGLQMQSDWPMPLAGVDCFVLRLPERDPRSADEVARALSQDRQVAWAQPMQVYHGQASPQPAPQADPLFASQPAARQWQLAALHEMATGRGVRIAVIDSGIAGAHPDLAGQLERNDNFVDGHPLRGESHGTAVAGIIAARAGNGQGIAGIAPQARLLGLRACWQAAGQARTVCTSLSLAKALNTAVEQRAQIINMSLAGPPDRLLALLIDQALARGIAVVAALGPSSAGFPASHPGVLAVGEAPPLPAGAVQAPGRDIPSPTAEGGWALVSGSSFAAAHISGLLALLRERDGRPFARADLITAAALDGRIDACATLLAHGGTSRRQACAAPGLMHTAN